MADDPRRDFRVPKHRTPSSVPVDLAAPDEVDAEDTGMHVAIDLRRQRRSARDTHARIGKLEDKHDAIVEKLDAIVEKHAEHGGTLIAIRGFMKAADDRAVAEFSAAAERA